MPKYCLDTSGLSNPLENMPEDIYSSLWDKVRKHVEDGTFCCNEEIMKEMHSLTGDIGDCIKGCSGTVCYELEDEKWPWLEYLEHVETMRVRYEPVISEYNGNRKNTVGLNDISIIAMAKTMGLPLVSMEKENTHQPSEKRMRIPDVCKSEGVVHMTFNEFLRAEGIKL